MISRLVRPILVGVLCLAAGCADAGPSMVPSGEWRTLPVPSGGYIQLSLSLAGSQVTGSGAAFGLMGVPEGTLGVTGTWSGDTFDLAIASVSGASRSAHYSGTVVGGARLEGDWVEVSHTARVVFLKAE